MARLFWILSAVIAFLRTATVAIEASPYQIEHTQPDGTPITVFVRGNEHYSWEEDEMQHTVMPTRQADGKIKYVYAALDRKRDLVASQDKVGKTLPRDSRLRLHERSRKYARHVQDLQSSRQQRSGNMRRQTTTLRTGTIKNLVVMLRHVNVEALSVHSTHWRTSIKLTV
jgi:hypothetical protein